MLFESLELLEQWEEENNYPNYIINGASGKNIGYTWITYTLDEEEIDIYLKE